MKLKSVMMNIEQNYKANTSLRLDKKKRHSVMPFFEDTLKNLLKCHLLPFRHAKRSEASRIVNQYLPEEDETFPFGFS